MSYQSDGQQGIYDTAVAVSYREANGRWIVVKSSALLFVAALAASCLTALAHAAERRVDYSKSYRNDSVVTYNDFHVVIRSDTGMTNVGATLDDDMSACHLPTSVKGEGSSILTYEWENVGLLFPPYPNDGSQPSVAITFKQEAKNEFSVNSYWTLGGVRTEADVQGLGLRVLPSGRLFLTNGTMSDMQFSGAQYVIQNDPLPLTLEERAALMSAIADGAPFPFSWTPLPDGSVAAQSETFMLDLTISEGQFLYVYVPVFSSSDPANIEPSLLGHEHQAQGAFQPVPALGRSALIATALLSAMVSLLVLWKTRSAARAG